jgi:hypothetical protein
MPSAYATTVSRRGVLTLGAVSTAGGTVAQTQSAVAWPDRPVRVINPAGPGSGIDLIARIPARLECAHTRVRTRGWRSIVRLHQL